MKRGTNRIAHPHADLLRALADQIASDAAGHEYDQTLILTREVKDALLWLSFLVDDNNAHHAIMPRPKGE